MIVFFHLNFRYWRLGAIRYQLRYTPLNSLRVAKIIIFNCYFCCFFNLNYSSGMTQSHRFQSIDIMKGIIVLLMLFVNDLFLPGLPPWLSGIDQGNNGWGIAGWVFPAFLFMTGMTIPFAIQKKINNGLFPYEISRQIIGKTIILLTIGVMMVNTYRVNPDLTGLSRYLWALLLFIAVFLVWNRYPEKENNFFTVISLRFAGLAIIVFLIFKFRSGSFENSGSLIVGWWDLPGLIGWGYLVSAFTFLAFRNSFTGTFLIWLSFLALNILCKLNLLGAIEPVRKYMGVITDGHVPFIFLSGHLTGLILKRFSTSESRKIVMLILPFSIALMMTGFVLKKLFFIEGIYDNPSIAILCSGICMVLFIPVFWISDIKNNGRWFLIFKPAGENALTTYFTSFIFYNLIWLCRFPLFFYKQSNYQLVALAGSALWALLMLFISSVIIRLNIRLKI
jgi:heparan-alpha-glucosaminide N-acetyltransferase